MSAPAWFVPSSGFQFWNRDALVIVLGYGDLADGQPPRTRRDCLVAAMRTGKSWCWVDLAMFGDEWGHSAPLSAPKCKTCNRVDCPTVGGCSEGCNPIVWSGE